MILAKLSFISVNKKTMDLRSPGPPTITTTNLLPGVPHQCRVMKARVYNMP